MLGDRLRVGNGVTVNLVEAVRYYRLSAEQNDACSQLQLGMCYLHGVGAPEDFVEAVRYFRLAAAERKLAKAQHNLGVCLKHGKGVKQDLVEAVRYFRLAAEQDLAAAQFNLGFCLAHGEGVARDIPQALRYYRLAAEQNNAHAQTNLGLILITSTSPAVARQPKEGALLLAKAAQQTGEEEISQIALECLSEHAHERDVVHACCIGCGKVKRLKVCSKCHVAKFCGAACVRRMWPVHKAGCKLWAAEAAALAAAPAAEMASPAAGPGSSAE